MAESRSHLLTKNHVRHMAYLNRDHFLVTLDKHCVFKTYRIDISGLSPIEECGYPMACAVPDPQDYCDRTGVWPSMIFDIGLVADGKVVIGLEVMKTSWISPEKRAKIMKTDVLVIGVGDKLDEWDIDNTKLDARDMVAPSKRSLERLSVVKLGFTP
jgi:hypothetical protein